MSIDDWLITFHGPIVACDCSPQPCSCWIGAGGCRVVHVQLVHITCRPESSPQWWPRACELSLDQLGLVTVSRAWPIAGQWSVSWTLQWPDASQLMPQGLSRSATAVHCSPCPVWAVQRPLELWNLVYTIQPVVRPLNNRLNNRLQMGSHARPFHVPDTWSLGDHSPEKPRKLRNVKEFYSFQTC